VHAGPTEIPCAVEDPEILRQPDL